MTAALVHIHHAEAISAAGDDLAAARATFAAGAQPFVVPTHFAARGVHHGLCAALQPSPRESRAIALLKRLLSRLPALGDDDAIYLATTVGAIDCLEQNASGPTPDCIGILLDAVQRHFPRCPVTLVAAACASGQSATAAAMRALRGGRCRRALVIGIDICSEFVTSGFVSLGAVSRTLTVTRPYDAQRDGLLLGEGAGALLLGLDAGGAGGTIGALLAAGESCDAAHITAPNLAGEQLAALITQTLGRAGLRPEQLGGIIGHGTGTIHNDQSELAALDLVFAGQGACPPLLSIKGNTGHTLAATGVLQIVYGLDFLRQGQLPPQAGLLQPAAGAERWVAAKTRPLRCPRLLSLNVGFGGLNSALILEGRA